MENENENVWGEDELFESSNVYQTLSVMGFRDGKQYANDIKRQEGFNVGFKVGQAIGKVFGRFLATLVIHNIQISENLLNYQEFDSIELLISELRKFEEKIETCPLEIREQYECLMKELEKAQLIS